MLVAALTLMLPQHIAAASEAVEDAGQDEHQVGQPVHVLARVVVDGLGVAQRDDAALGPATNGAADVRQRRCPRSGGQDEFTQGR